MPLALLVVAAACSKETPPAAEATRSPHAEAVAPATAAEPATRPAAEAIPAASGEPAAQAKFSEAGFDLVLQPKGTYKSGQAGEAEILLLAKEPFHVNDKYPYKFKVKEGAGVKYSAPVVTKDAVKLEQQKATMLVGFTPEAAGKHVLAGQFSFSVCTDDKCLIEKRDLSLEITAN